MTLVAIVAKLLLFLMHLEQEQMAMFTIFVNLFVILVGTFFSVRTHRASNPNSDMKADVKSGMKSATMFALCLSVFTWIYYTYIDTHYFPLLIEDRVEMAMEAAADNPEIDVENVRKTGEVWFSPRTHSTITLFGLTITGALYSFFIALLMRKVPGFGKK